MGGCEGGREGGGGSGQGGGGGALRERERENNNNKKRERWGEKKKESIERDCVLRNLSLPISLFNNNRITIRRIRGKRWERKRRRGLGETVCFGISVPLSLSPLSLSQIANCSVSLVR